MNTGARHDRHDRPGAAAAAIRAVRAALTHRSLPLVAALAGMLLTLPSLGVGLVIDDYFHRAVLLGSEVIGEYTDSPLDLFRFLDGDAERTNALIDLGILPWYTVPEIKISFWRPLAVLTHWLDYQLWPAHPVLMHAQSILWYGAAVFAVALLYRRILGPTWVAGFAAILYAVDDARGMPVAFLANRNVLLATFFGVLTLLAHARWRDERWRWGALVGPGLLGLSLLSKEAGLATCAYLFAYAVFLDRGPWRRRLLTLAPYALVVIVWRAVWSCLGHGFAHAGLYVDPLGEPLRYAAAVVERAPLLLLGQWALPPSGTSMLLAPAQVVWMWVAAVAFLMLLAFVLLPILRRDARARFWASGMVLALPPSCATIPSDRLLLFVGIGAAPLLAALVRAAFDGATRRSFGPGWRRVAATLAGLLLLIHVVLAPAMAPLRAAYPVGVSEGERNVVGAALDAAVRGQDVIIVNPPGVLHTALYPLQCEADGRPRPRRTRMLAPGFTRLHIERPDTHTLVIRPDGGFLAWSLDRLFRDERRPFVRGERFALTGLTIEIRELTRDARPAEAVFRFAVPLEDPALRWLCWKEGRVLPFTPPAVGESCELEPR